MTPDEKAALTQLEIAEAELALLKQELTLQHLINTREPTEAFPEATERAEGK